MKYNANEKNVLVIGYGNILRRDDGVGFAAARRLFDQLPGELASVLTVHQLLPELAQQISLARQVVFIDANAKLPPGTVQKSSVQPSPKGDYIFGHHQTPAGLLRLSGDLYGRVPEAMIFSIGGSDFSFGCTLSPPVQVAVRKVVRDVVDAVIHLSSERGCHA